MTSHPAVSRSLLSQQAPPDDEPIPDDAPLTPAETGYDDAARDARSKTRLLLAAFAIVMMGNVASATVIVGSGTVGAIGRRFATPQASWVLTVSSLVGVGAGILVGKLGDQYGKKLLTIILAVLTAGGAVVCAVSGDFGSLLVGRGLMGLGYAQAPLIYGLIRDLFPRRNIPMILGITAANLGMSATLDVIGVTWLLQSHSYTTVYWWTAALVGVGALLMLVCTPESPLRNRGGIDWIGVALIAMSAFSLVYGLNEVGIRGWESTWTIGFLIGGVVLAAVWAMYERVPEQALIGYRLLASKPLFLTMTLSFWFSMMTLGVALLLPIIATTPRALGGGVTAGYGLGLQPGGELRLLLPEVAACLVGSLFAGWMARTRGAYSVAIIAILFVSVGTALLATVTYQPERLVIATGLFGVGLGMADTVGPLMVIEAVPAHLQCAAAATVAIGQNLAVALGTQIFVPLIGHYTVPLPGRSAAAAAAQPIYSHQGLVVGLILATCLGVVGLVNAFLIPHCRTRSSGGALPTARRDMPVAV